MLNDQIIGLSAVEDGLDIVQPFMGEVLVNGIHDRDLFINDHIGIVGHAVWHLVLAFKKVDAVIVDAYIFDGIGDFHN